MILARHTIRATTASSGVDEMTAVYSQLNSDKRTVIKAKAHTTLLKEDGKNLGHGFDCHVMALSPSDKQLDIFMDDIAELMPNLAKSEARCVARNSNHFAVVCLVQIGPVSILLGADLQETADADNGWTIIVKSTIRPKQKAAIYKIPHHGSSNAHNDDVWTDMLINEPFAVLTPWSRGSGLPQKSDVQRIKSLTKNAYTTSKMEKSKSKAPRAHAVERTLREAGIVVSNAEPNLGHVRLRNGGPSAFDKWEVVVDTNACSLEQVAN